MKRSELKAKAKMQIEGKIGVLFLITLVMFFIAFIFSLLITLASIVALSLMPSSGIADMILDIGSIIVNVIITPAFALSVARVYVMLFKGETPDTNDAFSGFNDFWSAFKVTWLVSVYTFLWSLLFIVPGIIKGISYSMSMYILAENKGKPALECIRESEAMTKGHKKELFMLFLSFIGWNLLGVLTLGMAQIFWVIPYMNATFANAYDSLKNSAAAVDSPVENDGPRRRKSLIPQKKST